MSLDEFMETSTVRSLEALPPEIVLQLPHLLKKTGHLAKLRKLRAETMRAQKEQRQ